MCVYTVYTVVIHTLFKVRPHRKRKIEFSFGRHHAWNRDKYSAAERGGELSLRHLPPPGHLNPGPNPNPTVNPNRHLTLANYRPDGCETAAAAVNTATRMTAWLVVQRGGSHSNKMFRFRAAE